jgi:hypothetical protein
MYEIYKAKCVCVNVQIAVGLEKGRSDLSIHIYDLHRYL